MLPSPAEALTFSRTNPPCPLNDAPPNQGPGLAVVRASRKIVKAQRLSSSRASGGDRQERERRPDVPRRDDPVDPLRRFNRADTGPLSGCLARSFGETSPQEVHTAVEKCRAEKRREWIRQIDLEEVRMNLLS